MRYLIRKHLLCAVLASVIAAGIAGCSTINKITQPKAPADTAASTTPWPPYSGPQARIAVADFDVKAAKATGETGVGLRDMMVTALINTDRFRVVERQVLDRLKEEQELASSGTGEKAGVPQPATIKTADILITAAVVEFEPQASGGAGGIGGGGGAGSGVFGGLLGVTLNKAHMALDVRIIDASSSVVLAATRVQGQASDMAGGFMGGFFGGWSLGTGLSGYANTPMEKAIRICVIEAVRYIAQAVPQKYYK